MAAAAAPRPLLLLLPLLLCLCVAVHPLAAVDQIKETCGRTPFPDLCATSLLRMPESHGADAHHLAELAIRAAAEMATNTSAYISHLLETQIKDPKWQQCLYDCTEQYVDAIDQLDDSTGAMDEHNYDHVKSWLSAAMANADTCDSGCQEAGAPDKAKFSKLNGEFRNLCGVILAIVKQLVRK